VGLTALIDGHVVGYAGLHRIAGRHWGFFLLAGEGGIRLRAQRPRFLHRLALEGLMAFEAAGIEEICALRDTRQPRAARWLEALGFRPLADREKTEDILRFEALCGGLDSWVRVGRA
jgi:hypothetical protein